MHRASLTTPPAKTRPHSLSQNPQSKSPLQGNPQGSPVTSPNNMYIFQHKGQHHSGRQEENKPDNKTAKKEKSKKPGKDKTVRECERESRLQSANRDRNNERHSNNIKREVKKNTSISQREQPRNSSKKTKNARPQNKATLQLITPNKLNHQLYQQSKFQSLIHQIPQDPSTSSLSKLQNYLNKSSFHHSHLIETTNNHVISQFGLTQQKYQQQIRELQQQRERILAQSEKQVQFLKAEIENMRKNAHFVNGFSTGYKQNLVSLSKTQQDGSMSHDLTVKQQQCQALALKLEREQRKNKQHEETIGKLIRQRQVIKRETEQVLAIVRGEMREIKGCPSAGTSTQSYFS